MIPLCNTKQDSRAGVIIILYITEQAVYVVYRVSVVTFGAGTKGSSRAAIAWWLPRKKCKQPFCKVASSSEIQKLVVLAELKANE